MVHRPLSLALLSSLALLGTPEAEAFCGTFVGTSDAPTNGASQVAIVRRDNRTTLTVSNDIHGDTRDFALLVPVPEVLPESAIHVLDPGVFDRLRGYSAPREVSYRCEDFAYESDTDTDTDTDADSDADTGDAGGVEVEAEYVVGEYLVRILAAEESTALVTWLQDNGYSVPDASAELLGEYIEAGSHFFAAQVRPDARIADGATLSPLQFSYTSASYSLPIRIGTLNSPGEQDLLVYAINSYEDGAVRVANYPEATIETDCMLESGADLDAHVATSLNAAFAENARASWVSEYTWGNGSCDPCTGGQLEEQDLMNIGFDPDYHYGFNYFFTRLHLRYTPQAADQDLSLYLSRDTSANQLRYIQYNYEMEDRFPTCGTGFPANPGSCDGSGEDDAGDEVNDDPEGSDDLDLSVACGCASDGSGRATWALAPLLAVLLGRRRR